MNLSKSKRASEFDIIFIMVIGLMIFVTSLFVVKIYDEYAFKTQSYFNTSAAGAQVFSTGTNKLVPMFDNVFVAIFTGLIFISIVSALFIRTHPVFFIISLILVAIALILSSIFANLSTVFSNSSLGTYKTLSGDPFTKSKYIMDHLPLIVMGTSIMLIIVLYSFGRNAV